jgi:ubiquinone/menaquinone biosynthesis C-methylase UbiE
MVRSLIDSIGMEAAMRATPGGDFVGIGSIERDLVIQHGLKRDGYLIDVGCASGRLAHPLSEYLSGKYLGLDIVPELVDYARRLVGRSDWRFEVGTGITIPEKDNQADMVCFFSVFTHLLHENSYLYLQEAARVLKPSGKIVFSFLEFETEWSVFETAIQKLGDGSYPMTMFVGRDAIRAWAQHLNLRIDTIVGASEPHVDLSHPVTHDDGTVVSGKVPFRQSLCVLAVE